MRKGPYANKNLQLVTLAIMMRYINQKIGWSSSYLILCLVLFPVVVFFSFSKPWPLGYDFWETAATVRELADNPLHPSNSILMLPGDTS